MDATRPSTGTGSPAGTARLGRAPAAASGLLAVAGIFLAVVGPASSATIDRSWRASVGASAANGTVTVVALTAGTGTVTMRLKALRAGTPVTVTIRAGTCAKPSTVAAALPAMRSSTAGAVSRTAAVSRAAVSRMKTARTLVVQVRSSGWSRCAGLKAVTTPGPSPSPSASSEVEVHARDFAFTPSTITAAAGRPIVVSFRNDDAGVTHGLNVGTSRSAAPIASAGVITGVARTTFTIPALPAGAYAFWCPVHSSMNGTLVVAGIAAASANPTAAAGATASPATTPDATPEPTRSPEPTPTYYPY